MLAIRALSLGMLGALAGCVAAPPSGPESYTLHLLTPAETRQVEADVLRSRAVAEGLFSSMQAARSSSGSLIVCGWVRVRSDLPEYARYPENRPFVVSYRSDRLDGFRTLYFADVKSEAPPLYTYCSRRGIPL